MTVKELIDKLNIMVEKRKRIANMDVAFFIPMLDEPDEDDINTSNHHALINLKEKNIYVNEWFNGETWDDSNDSFEYVEIKIE